MPRGIYDHTNHPGCWRKGVYTKTQFQKGNQLGKMNAGENNGNWKGDSAGKIAIHSWVVKQQGKASLYKCIDCGNQARVWSNINHHIYRRVLEDYIPRCQSCHAKFDKVNCKASKSDE